MSNGIKTIAYILLSFLMIWLVFGFVVTVLPWLILGGVIIYFIVKIKGAVLNKKASKNDTYDVEYTEYNTSKENNGATFEATNEVEKASVIDVDYKEVE